LLGHFLGRVRKEGFFSEDPLTLVWLAGSETQEVKVHFSPFPVLRFKMFECALQKPEK